MKMLLKKLRLKLLPRKQPLRLKSKRLKQLLRLKLRLQKKLLPRHLLMLKLPQLKLPEKLPKRKLLLLKSIWPLLNNNKNSRPLMSRTIPPQWRLLLRMLRTCSIQTIKLLRILICMIEEKIG